MLRLFGYVILHCVVRGYVVTHVTLPTHTVHLRLILRFAVVVGFVDASFGTPRTGLRYPAFTLPAPRYVGLVVTHTHTRFPRARTLVGYVTAHCGYGLQFAHVYAPPLAGLVRLRYAVGYGYGLCGYTFARLVYGYGCFALRWLLFHLLRWLRLRLLGCCGCWVRLRSLRFAFTWLVTLILRWFRPRIAVTRAAFHARLHCYSSGSRFTALMPSSPHG